MKQAAFVLVYGSLAFFMGLGAFGLFLEDPTVWIGMGLCFFTFVIGGVLLLGHAVFRPSMEKLNSVILAASVAAVCLKTEASIQRWGVDFFWSVREAPATAFVAELLSYNRIYEMDDGARYYKSLNHAILDPPPLPGASRSAEVPPDVFQRDGINTRVFAAFREKLRALGLHSVSVTDGYVAFVDDGMLDNLRGFVWVRPGHSPPPIKGEFVDATQLISLRPLRNGWYFFLTT